MLDKRLVWQPTDLYQTGHEFNIILDRKFAEEMLSVKINSQTRRRLDEVIKELNPKNFNPHFQYYEDTAFVLQFNLGFGGNWLAVNGTYGKNPLDVFDDFYIPYSSHNVDTSADAYSLMRLVDFWVEHADTIKELSK
ncbi:MAG: hypothetical protein WD876_01780 [Candidatus Pacearchaeota archaeon]